MSLGKARGRRLADLEDARKPLDLDLRKRDHRIKVARYEACPVVSA